MDGPGRPVDLHAVTWRTRCMLTPAARCRVSFCSGTSPRNGHEPFFCNGQPQGWRQRPGPFMLVILVLILIFSKSYSVILASHAVSSFCSGRRLGPIPIGGEAAPPPAGTHCSIACPTHPLSHISHRSYLQWCRTSCRASGEHTDPEAEAGSRSSRPPAPCCTSTQSYCE